MDGGRPWHLFCSEDMIACGKRGQKLRKLSRLGNGGELMDVFEPGNDDFCYRSSRMPIPRCGPIIDVPVLNKEVASDAFDAYSFDDKGPGGACDPLIDALALDKGVASDSIDAHSCDDTSLSPLVSR
ncbi:hypothetical protein AgCh_008874 [Apium graveolens]